MTNKTIERQSAAKAVAEIFHGQGPLTDEEKQQYKELTEDVAHFNKTGSFKELRSPDQDQEPQKVEIEIATDDAGKSEQNSDEDEE
ncbi:hypothetical protein [Natrinema sp. H-ect4]|uniref:hypothetical protein n=1 Tax=Natrinema sp. H-ect4 TaxID=3242699 RepID=UPI0035A945AD